MQPETSLDGYKNKYHPTKNKNLPNLIGCVFGRLTVIEYLGIGNHRWRYWECLCTCGNKIRLASLFLNSGHTKSCGCLRIESSRKSLTTHGKSNMPEYEVYITMKKRCYNKKHISYKDYGGRGITVCDKWLNSFTEFLSDMGNRPGKHYSIDRINNNGNYTPTNCRWATKKEQNSNTRRNNWIEYNGEKMILADWARKIKIRQSRLGLLLRKGISFSEIINNYKNGKQITRYVFRSIR